MLFTKFEIGLVVLENAQRFFLGGLVVGGWFWGADPGISIRGGAMFHVLAGAWGPSIGPQQVQGSSPKMF